MATLFTIKKGDNLPALLVTLTDGAAAAINVSAATSVTFRMRKSDAQPHTLKVNRAAQLNTDGIDGKVKITFTSAETDTPGDYLGEFLINWGSGNLQTVPSADFVRVSVIDVA